MKHLIIITLLALSPLIHASPTPTEEQCDVAEDSLRDAMAEITMPWSGQPAEVEIFCSSSLDPWVKEHCSTLKRCK